MSGTTHSNQAQRLTTKSMSSDQVSLLKVEFLIFLHRINGLCMKYLSCNLELKKCKPRAFNKLYTQNGEHDRAIEDR